MQWAPAKEGNQGATWLELYIRYALDGGQMQTEWEKEQSRGKDVSKREAIRRFSKIARRMLDTAAEHHVKHLFRPSKEKARRLLPLGIATHLAAITSVPCWSEKQATEVAHEIIEATHARTEKQKNELRNRKLKVFLKPIRLVGKQLCSKNKGTSYLKKIIRIRKLKDKEQSQQSPARQED